MKSVAARLSLSQQFLLVSFPIMLATAVVIGWWIGRQVHESAVQRIGADTAFYVDGFIAPHLRRIGTTGVLDAAGRRELDGLMDDAEWARRIVLLRIWRPDGTVLFSSDGEGIGQRRAVGEGLRTANAGSIHSALSVRRGRAQADHRQPLERAIETYTPIHTADRGRIGAVAEFYQLPDEVDREAASAQRRSWGVVAGVMLAAYLLLFALVRRGSRTIASQQAALSDQVERLTDLGAQNRVLHSRVRRAAEDAIVLHESLLQRVSANVHDGPCQDLGFALMQLRNLRDGHRDRGPETTGELDRIGDAVQAAMADLRAISADLELPDIGPLGIDEVAARVVRDFQAKTHYAVTLSTEVPPGPDAHVRIKTTLYRLLQESLSNSFRHAAGAPCRIAVRAGANAVAVEVHDDGPGFDRAAVQARRRLGLSGMRQRVESLGGVFEVISGAGRGTTIRVRLPLTERDIERESGRE